MKFKGKRGLIIGSGESGRGAEYALRIMGAKTDVIDTEYMPSDMNVYDFIVVSPGIRRSHPVYKFAEIRDVPLFGEIGLGAMLNTAPVLAVTGTNGKTTTVEMLGKIYSEAGIKAEVCGNIGRSFARVAGDGNYQRIILELSSFQLLQAKPLKVRIGCITNFSADHLDYHGNMLEYRHAKLHIADGQTNADYLLVPEKFNLVGISGNPSIIRAGRDFYEKDGVLYIFGKRLMRADELGTKGKHNVENALCAGTMAKLDGIADEDIITALTRFLPDKYRITQVGEFNGTAYFDDSKGTNVSACLSAIRCMNGTVGLIIGGSDKGYDFDDLFSEMPQNVTAVFVCGENARIIMDSARRIGYKDVMTVNELSEAVRLASLGGFDNVLFSPASASFDRYANYKERGDAFEREVKKLFSAH